jgi:hypothetical protein
VTESGSWSAAERSGEALKAQRLRRALLDGGHHVIEVCLVDFWRLNDNPGIGTEDEAVREGEHAEGVALASWWCGGLPPTCEKGHTENGGGPDGLRVVARRETCARRPGNLSKGVAPAGDAELPRGPDAVEPGARVPGPPGERRWAD